VGIASAAAVFYRLGFSVWFDEVVDQTTARGSAVDLSAYLYGPTGP
jgi:hypothetical protein